MAARAYVITYVICECMKRLFSRIGAWSRANPLYAFLIAAGLLTLVAGIAAFTPRNEPAARLATSEESNEDTLTPTRAPRERFGGEEDGAQTTPTRRPASSNKDTAPTRRPSPTDEAQPTTEATPSPTETPTPTPQKTFNYNANGDAFIDKNCNGTQDSDETRFTTGMTINFFKVSDGSAFASEKTDGNGHYSLQKTASKGEKISLRLEPVIPAGYKIRPGTAYPAFEFSEANPHNRFDLPLVPDENAGACES